MCGIGDGILVLRCHNLETAIRAVGNAVAANEIPVDLAGQITRGGFEAASIWVRYVPNDYADPTAGGVWEREARGTNGATPAVLFANPKEVNP